MNFKNTIKDCMKEEYAKQICSWIYEDKYSDYNLTSYEECKEKRYGITREEEKNNYIVYLIDDEVVFYSYMKLMDNNKLYIGEGLKPDFCGNGYGNYFLRDSINEMRKRYPNTTFFLEVRSWNKRAIKSYEKIGFKKTNVVISKDRLGNDTEFVEMEMK